MHLCLLAKIVWSLLTLFFKPKTNKQNSCDYSRWIYCVLTGTLLKLWQSWLCSCASKSPCSGSFPRSSLRAERTLRTRQSQVPCLRDRWRGISRETNILEPPSADVKHFPSLLYSAALDELAARHSRRAPRCVFCWFHRFRCSMIGLCCAQKDAQGVLLTSLLLCCNSGQLSCFPPAVSELSNLLERLDVWLIDQPNIKSPEYQKMLL